MTKIIWYIAKRGEQRDFATTNPPSEHWAKNLKAQGYEIISVEFTMPEGWDSSDHAAKGTIQ